MGAGRPKKKGSGVSHLQRPRHAARHPLHVTLRVVEGLGNLRKGPLRRAIYRAMAGGCDRFGFRLVHFTVQSNHLHLVCEAKDERALAKGMQGLSIRIAKALNRRLDKSGRVFADRYHCRALKTPREVRRALSYVLCNAQRHASRPPAWIDPCSSAAMFTGWRGGVLIDIDIIEELCADIGPPVAPAHTWLLTTGWKRYGKLDPDEVAGPQQRQTSRARA